jgi:hypothetical protein
MYVKRVLPHQGQNVTSIELISLKLINKTFCSYQQMKEKLMCLEHN